MTKQKIDIEKALTKFETVTEIPKVANRGKTAINYKPIVDLALSKGIIRISEREFNIKSGVNGLKKYITREKINLNIYTRKVNGTIFMYLQKPYKKS